MNARFALFAIAIVVTAVMTARVVSQNDHNGQEHDHAHDEHQVALPGPEHKLLAKYAGEWTTTMTFSAPDMAPSPPVTGSAKITSELGGRFLNDASKGEMMGEPFESRHYTGYNSSAKRYESIWTWTNDNGMLRFTGASEDGGKTINWTGEYTDLAGQPQAIKAVTKHIDDDRFTIELHGEGDHAGVMTTEYTRKK